MAREHARILTRIWDDPDFCGLPMHQQRLYFLLLSRRNMVSCGVLPLQVRKWAKGAKDTSEEDIVKTLAELEAGRYVFVDEDTEEVLVRTLIRNDGVLKVPNVFKAALKAALNIESPKLREVLAGELRKIGRGDADEVAQELFPIESERDPEPIGIESGTVDNPSTPVDNLLNSNVIPTSGGEGVGEGVGEPLVGGSVGRPRERCGRHLNDTDPPNCRGCAKARETAERWDRDTAAALKAAVRACKLCDADGYRFVPGRRVIATPYVRCDHRPLAAVS